MTDPTSIQRVIAGKGGELPTPYGGVFEKGEDPLQRALDDYNRAEEHRIKFGKFASKPYIVIMRRATGLLIALTALSGVVAPDHPLTRPTLMLLLWIPLLTLSIGPALIAGERAMTAMVLRSSLWKQGAIVKGMSRDMMAEPGMGRIKTGLNDARKHNAIATAFAGFSIFLLVVAGGLETDSLAYNFVLLVTMASSLALSFHAIFTTDEIRRLGDRLPYLVLHSPTNHPTQLDTILGDLVFAHLDPDLSLSWGQWENQLSRSLLPGVDSMQARERILYLLHLNGRGDLSDEDTLGELKEFINSTSIKPLLLDEESEFNWKRLQRLIEHARAWRGEVFDLLDRLQNDLLSGSSSITQDDWRMDLALAPRSDDGTGHLFIALNNQTEENRHLRVEVIVPGGMPESQEHRFELTACPGPEGPVKIADKLLEDALDWMPRYLETGVILWIGISWGRKLRGIRNVQVILRDDDGVVMDSRIIRTEAYSGESNLAGRRLKRMLAARKTGETPLPSDLNVGVSA